MAGKVSNTLQSIRRIEARLGRLETRVEEGFAAVDEGFATVNERFVRVSTEMTAVVGAVHDVRDVILARLDVRERVDAIDRRLAEVERKTG